MGSIVLSAGEAVIYGCSFVRNMLLARLLSKADFGIAATFAMFITLLEFSAKLGIARFVVRDPDAGEPEFVAAAHLAQGAAAAVSAAAMLAAAWPIANVFGIPEQAGALFVLAAIPLLNGLAHLDVRRFERDLRFGPSTVVEMIPQIVITLAAWPVATWLGDYRAMVVLLVMKAVLSCLGSHWLAEQPYRWRLHKGHLTRMLSFGWPLLVNGFLMFGVMQGDQFLVATFYSMTDLAPYAAAAALTMAPSFVFGRIFNPIALPLLAGVQHDRSAFERRYRTVLAVIAVFTAAYAVGAIVGAEPLMRVAYGAKYAGAGVILGWLAAANSFRNIRIAPAIAATARGDSVNQMQSSFARIIGLAPALALAVAHQPVWTIACAGLVGEALACSASFWRLSSQQHVPVSMNFRATALVAVAVAVAALTSAVATPRVSSAAALALALAGALTAGVIVAGLLAETRQEASRAWRLMCELGPRRSLAALRAGGAAEPGPRT